MRSLPERVIPRKLHLYHVAMNQINGDDASLFVWACDIGQAAQIYISTAAMFEWEFSDRYSSSISMEVISHIVRVPLERPESARAVDWVPLLEAARKEANHLINEQVERRIAAQ